MQFIFCYTFLFFAPSESDLCDTRVRVAFQPGAPPTSHAFRSKSSAPTNFRKFYERGDFPVALEHDTKGNKIAWKVISLRLCDQITSLGIVSIA